MTEDVKPTANRTLFAMKHENKGVISMHWLLDYWNLKKEIVDFENKLIQLKEEPVEPSVIQWLEDFIQAKKSDKLELEKLVGTFGNLDNQILKMKYIDGVFLKDIGEKLGYSARHIYTAHAKLMKNLKEETAGEYHEFMDR
ncbi:sigma-70 RNA polymerase sigma factor region 4 domain-containing protein [Sporosarcina cascadiensis]|uniref:sigma-70 family RNA polymerase sigma factor n=1 Tax=Sporosarcina cascadiensis TaxID=2660747 RepID=UPI00129A84F3|nr:sigma-70 family RNA polymerase sigma factor [Sporosarcina cascadiensis]